MAVFANNTSAIVSNGGTDAPASGTTEQWTISSYTGFPGSLTGGNFFHVADPAASTEKIRVTGIASGVWSVTRGDESTTPVAHTTGFTIIQVVSAGDFTDAVPLSWYNVKAYGATGNGSTDDTAAIASAISAATAATGGTIFFPVGTYLISSSLNVGGGFPGGLQILGAGWESEILLKGTANCYMFDTGNGTGPTYTPGLKIADIYLNCNGFHQTASSGALYGRGMVFGVLDHVWVDQPYEYGVHFYQDGLGDYGHHNRVYGCLFTNGYTSASYGLGLKFEQADENTVMGCTFQDNGTTTFPSTQLYDTSAGLQSILGCSFVTTRSTGCSMVKSDSSPSRLLIHGCHFDSSTTGNLVELDGPGSNVVGNEFLSFGSSANAAVNMNSVCTIVANVFYPAGTLGSAINEGSNGDNVVADNVVKGTFSTSNGIFANQAATSRYVNNTGYNPVGFLTAPSIPGSTTALTNPFPLECQIYLTGGTVSAIAVNGTATGLTNGTFILEPTETITLTYTSAPTWKWFGN